MNPTLLLLVGALSVVLATRLPIDGPVLIQAHNEQDSLDYRLDNRVHPIHYDIHLTPYFVQEEDKPAFSFDGEVKIQIRAGQADVNRIVLHASRLTILEWRVHALNDRNDLMSDVTTAPVETIATDKLELPLIQPLLLDTTYVIEIKYVGELANDMFGFYRSYYSDNGVTKWLGSTQFQATSARRAFPCFDEPRFKATFQLTMDRPSGFSPTIFNTRIETETPLPAGRQRELFKPTPIMSSYQLAFVVSEYVGRSNDADNQVTHARPGAIDQSVYAVSFADAVLKEFDTYTGNAFLSVPQIEKLDLVAIPDFPAGSMGNWGLMTYRESLLLSDANHTTTLQKQHIAAAISHEVAHQWFGALVTCEWWDNTWLNEGFATFFQYFATHWVETQWQMDLQFIVEQYHSAFQVDALETTHAMTNTISSPAQISENFDSISKNKAGAVLRMMEHVLGANTFRTALQNYLRQHALSNTRPEDLLAAFQTQLTTLEMASIMEPWITQPGYPYITVSVSGAEVTVTQKRFLVRNKDHTDATLWPIVMSFAMSQGEFANTRPQQFFNQEDGSEKRFTLTTAPTDYFVVNNQQTGFYRVNYDAESWAKIKAALHSENHGGIHVANRAQIVDDLFNFARAGIVDYSTALGILGYIVAEKSYTPWLAFFNGLTYVTRRIVGDTANAEFSHFVLDTLSEIYGDLGYEARETDTHTQILLRNHVLAWACRYGHEDCLKETRAEYARFVAAPDTYLVNPDHRALVYCQGVRDGDLANLLRLWDRYLAVNVAHEKITIINAMGCTRTAEHLKVFLDNILEDSIRYQDKALAFRSALSGNPENVNAVFDYLTRNYERWATNFDFNGMASVASAFSTIADHFTGTAQVNILVMFLTANQQTLGAENTQSIRNAVADAEWEIEWAKRNSPNVLDFLVDRRNSASLTVATGFISSVILAIVLTVL